MGDSRVARRAAELQPEERTTEDPQAQAKAILAESDERQDRREPVEERTSDEVTPPA
ncbi:MAG TPA: hypothetical protein VGO92_11625 [Acidimicrobiales bacterium]|jgi:hypothetical protein|nr:hypothetical protein [Acidimicrobiales bacterium]